MKGRAVTKKDEYDPELDYLVHNGLIGRAEGEKEQQHPKYYYPEVFKKIHDTLTEDKVCFGCDDKGDICGILYMVRLGLKVRIILREDGFMVDKMMIPEDKIRVLEYLNDYFPSFKFIGYNKFINVMI